MDTQKLQKVPPPERGLGSRRELEGWIAAGRVTVNGETAHVGQRVGAEDAIALDGRRLAARSNEPSRVLVLNKAAGVICTRRDPEGRRSVFEGLPTLRSGRWIAVGRLDIQTTGLLLLTNDGALAQPDDAPVDRARPRVRRAGGCAPGRSRVAGADHGPHRRWRTAAVQERQRFSDVKYFDGSGRNHWYHVVLMEGRNREVRKLFEAVGARVSRLKRVRYGPVMLPSRLKRGALAEMEQPDLKQLYGLLKLPITPHRGRVSRKRRASLLLPYPPLKHLRPAGQQSPGDLSPRISQRHASTC